MPQDKFSAVWLSHSSLTDFLKCQRLYFLHNVYRDPKTGHKMGIMNPSLALGQTVHIVLEELSTLPVEKRFKTSLIERYEQVWESVTGEKGGFKSKEEEEEIKKRGEKMLKRVMNNPGSLLNKAVKINQDLPHFLLSPEENIILCGKVDWLEYLPETDSVHIIDFKTGKKEEDPDSLQLPIYHLLVQTCQKRTVSKASYWYLETNDTLTEKELSDTQAARDHLLHLGKQVKQARSEKLFECRKKGCYHCEPYERILKQQAKQVGVNEYNQDIYILN